MSRGLSRAEVQSIALDFVESLNYKVPLDFRIRDTWKQLYGADGLCGGAFHSAESKSDRGFVTIAANNHKSKEAVQRTLQHEILGHYLINTYSPLAKREVIGRIMASQNEPSLEEQWRKVRFAYPDKPLSIQAEELFASIAERVDINKSPNISADPLLENSTALTLQSIETSIQYRANTLKDGNLTQQTFPDTDVHSGPFIGANLERRVTEWRSNNPTDHQSKTPSPKI
jgi:hypothetical protein